MHNPILLAEITNKKQMEINESKVKITNTKNNTKYAKRYALI